MLLLQDKKNRVYVHRDIWLQYSGTWYVSVLCFRFIDGNSMVHSSNATAINAQITKINNILKQLRVRFYAAQHKKKNNSNVMIIHPV